MPENHTITAPARLPFHAESFTWEHFERFCGAYMVAGTSLPNPNASESAPARLRILDAVRYGSPGAKQRGIDFLATMENRSTWVLQCKRIANFRKGDAEKAIAKAETEFGPRHPARYLLWVSGGVSPDALDLVHQSHPDWTLWDGERISNEFLLHTPPRQCCQIISGIFGGGCAKAFFPLPDELLIRTDEFFSRWAGGGKLFHHEAAFVGREALLDQVLAFARGGKGSRALILSAPGGIGKTRLLRAVAERLESEATGRLVRFTNPDASLEAEPPRYEDAAQMSVFHDDAHRIESIPGLLVRILAAQQSGGSRLILAARPGAGEVLRERLMESGYASTDIETLDVKKLKNPEMERLAMACLGVEKEHLARSLAGIADGCALITLVGGELLRRGELTHLDLIQSAHFRAEVFRRFEGQELDRIRGSLDRPVMEKLLRSIALLSPWEAHDPAKAAAMADFLGIARGQLDAACDSLLASGLLLRTQQGLRITPDLFAEHLVYAACYDESGETTELIRTFLDRFSETYSQVILKNVAETEWRAIQQHGTTAASVVAPIWQRFLSDFTGASFWERSQMMERWSHFAVYQPQRSLELAEWAMDMTADPEGSIVLAQVPGLLKPVAIWSDEYRQAALDALWRLRRDFPMPKEHYGVFAEVASFAYNFPDAPSGVLDWLERLLESEDGIAIADKSCELLDTVLRRYIVQIIEQNYMSDRRTFTFSKIPICISKTKSLRHRALALLAEKIIPRGTIAAMNALPVLVEAFAQTAAWHNLPPALMPAWRPERKRALEAIAAVAARYSHPLIHYSIQHRLRGHIIYGWDEGFRPDCEKIVASLPDTFELRLARFTLSWGHDDLFEDYDTENSAQWHEKVEGHWRALKRSVASELLTTYPDALSVHDFIDQRSRTCAEHGLTTHLGELLNEVAQQNQSLAFEVLEIIHQRPTSELAGYAATLIATVPSDLPDLVEKAVLRGLESPVPATVQSFLNSIFYRDDLRSTDIETALLRLAARAEGSVLQALIGMIQNAGNREWSNPLLLALLGRTLSDEEAGSLANAVWHSLRYGGGIVEELAIFKMMDRLAQSLQLTDSYDCTGFLHEAARRYPRRMYELLIQRIEREQAGGCEGFQAIPYSCRLSLAGIEKEPDFEHIASTLFRRIFEHPRKQRWQWEQVFRMAVAHTSPMIETLLAEILPQIRNADDLADAAGLLGFGGSLLVFRYPQLTEAILKKARNFGTEAFERITWKLIHGAGPEMRGYKNGQLDSQYRYLQAEAEKAVQIHESNRILGPFYQRIVESEIRDQARHRNEHEAEDAEDW